MDSNDVVERLYALADADWATGMKSGAGITGGQVLGISMPKLRKLGKEIGKDHELAQAAWETGLHEARILASLIDDPAQVTEAQMEAWVVAFDAWDVCDQVCMNLFDKTPFAYQKALEWSEREPEFEKRAGFAMMAVLAWHDKTAPDDQFLQFLPVIKREAHDKRNFVKKAVNWALRQIGKRNKALNAAAITTARELEAMDAKAAQWIGRNAVKELTSDKTQARLS